MKFNTSNNKLSATILSASLLTELLMPTSVKAVPAMSWQSGVIGYPPSECTSIAARVTSQLGLSTTQEDGLVKAFTSKTGIIVFCDLSTQDVGACGGNSSRVTMFVTSESSEERDQFSAAMSKRLLDIDAPGCL